MPLIKAQSLFSNRDSLLQHLNDELSILSPVGDVEFESMKWTFDNHTAVKTQGITLDFSLFECRHLKFTDTVKLVFDEKKYQVTSVELAKIIFLSTASSTSSGSYGLGVYQLARLFAFLTEENITCLESNDSYQAMFQYLMTMDVNISGVKQRFSSLSHSGAFNISIDKILGVLDLYGIEGVLSPIPESHIRKALKSAVEVVTGLTLADYKVGGSFNFLSLAIGKHYIDYCGKYFEQNYPLAKTLYSCLQELPELIQKAFESQVGSRLKSERHLKTHIAAELTGRNILTDPFLISSGRQKGQFVITKARCELIQKMTHDYFIHKNQLVYEEKILFSEQGLALLSKKLTLPERFDNFEFLRALLLSHFINTPLPRSPEALLKQYCATLEGKRQITLTQFLKASTEVKKQLLEQVPKSKQSLEQLLTQANLPIARGGHGIRELLGNVEASGCTLMLSLTGWRASEYGFSLSAITIKSNEDILDSTYTPFRFILNWVVPKTNGRSKLDREITLSAYLIAHQLNYLNAENDASPCLYSSGMKKSDANESSQMFSYRVMRMWGHFVHNYTPFNELKKLDYLKQKEILSENDRREFTRLTLTYPDNAYTADFRHTMQKVTNDLPLLQAAGLLANNKEDRPAHKVFGFIKRTLSVDELAIWHKHLDPLLMQKLNELKVETPADLAADLVRACTNALINVCAYPTPHGFRHIWAEAVLRRYSGDVGWFIRSHFKHLDERFFLRYLRLKNFKDIHDIAKRTAISDIVRTHMMSLRDDHRAYAGKFDVFIRRLGKATKVIPLDQLTEVADKFTSTEVIDMTANAWNNCIVRRTTEKQAKCAIDGEPQSQNAEPSLCIGCINGNVEDGHVVGIMLHVENHVKVLKNPNLPEFFKRKSRSTVIEAKKQFLQLKRNSGNNKYDKHIQYFDDVLIAGG